MTDISKYIIEKCYIGGKYVGGNILTMNVVNPATQEVIGTVPDLDRVALTKAVDSSYKAFKTWSKTTVKERYNILRRWYTLILENKNKIAELLTLEQGKALDQARGEIEYGAEFADWFACQIRSHTDSLVPSIFANQTRKFIYEPIGPVAAITPWNFPMAMITRKIAPAIAAGCSVILKPSEETPYSALYQAELLTKAGLPAGVLNVVTCEPNRFSDLIAEDSRIRKLSFTGSTRVGKLLYEKCTDTFKKVSLELGGNAPYIVFPDVNIDEVAQDLVRIKTRSGGQACTSPNRVFIHRAMYKRMTEKLASLFSAMKVGGGFEKDTVVGPLINMKAVDKIVGLIDDATSKGAKILCGGKNRNNFFDCTVIKDCTDEMAIFREEIFGPVIACYVFDDHEEVLSRANNTEYGLMSYCYCLDTNIAEFMAKNLNFGMVNINSSNPATADTPFSGRKCSGFGIEGAKEGLYEFMHTKYVNFNL